MFDKLIVSSKSQGRGRTFGFLLGTSAVYLIILASALAVSVITIAPRLADNDGPSRSLPLTFPSARREASAAARGPAPQAAKPSIYNPMELSNILSVDQDSRKPVSWGSGPPVTGPVTGPIGDGPGSGAPSVIDGFPDAHGGGDGNDRGNAPPPPPPQKPPAKQPEREPRGPVRMASTVLQGKAIERRTPAYPAIARQTRLEGSVAVEIVIIAGRARRVVAGAERPPVICPLGDRCGAPVAIRAHSAQRHARPRDRHNHFRLQAVIGEAAEEVTSDATRLRRVPRAGTGKTRMPR